MRSRASSTCRMLPIDALTFRQAYNGIANSTLWFLLHMLYESARSPVFDQAWRRSWAGYQRYNRAFAEAIAAEAAEGATVMIQDYHLFLAPRLLRDLRPDVRIGHFTHIPWVPAEYFHMLPDDVAQDVLDGLSRRRRRGVPLRPMARTSFVDCCRSILGQTPASRMEVFPLSTEADELLQRAHRRDVDSSVRQLREVAGDRKVIGRVDRTELSKNVFRGLLAYRELLRAARRVARPGRAHRRQLPVARGPAGVPRVHRAGIARWPERSTTSSAPTRGRRCYSISATTIRVRSLRCGCPTWCSSTRSVTA